MVYGEEQMITDILYTNPDHEGNWFYERYCKPYGNSNSRYFTFQIALNLLRQRHSNPTIIETGCQREEEDVGAGMSTSIFAEYIEKYGGKLISVDNEQMHLDRSIRYVQKWPAAQVKFICMDSIAYLKTYIGRCDLLYLDSLDYPIAENEGNKEMQRAAQIHCLNEFKAIEDQLSHNSIVLLDDNQFSGGGKPKLAKDYLLQQGYICILDLQSSLWIKGI